MELELHVKVLRVVPPLFFKVPFNTKIVVPFPFAIEETMTVVEDEIVKVLVLPPPPPVRVSAFVVNTPEPVIAPVVEFPLEVTLLKVLSTSILSVPP